MDTPDRRKQLRLLQNQRCKIQRKITELQLTTTYHNITEELRLFNYWKTELDTCKAKFEQVVREHQVLEAHYQTRLDAASAKLDAAKKGESKQIKIQQLRLSDVEEDIDECEAIINGRLSKRQITAREQVAKSLQQLEDVELRHMMDEVRSRPKIESTTPIVLKKPKKVASKANLQIISPPVDGEALDQSGRQHQL